MSTFVKKTQHPTTRKWHDAIWIDDFYGNHNYGVKFPNGDIFDPREYKLKTKS